MKRTFELLLFCLCLSFPTAASAATLYVDAALTSPGDGTSWERAFGTIGDALTSATAGDSIWVAEGTYLESIVMKSTVSLYGGFEAGATTLSQRDFAAHETTIDASTARNGKPALHVVTMEDVSNVRLDGFVVTGGSANGPMSSYREKLGGGVFSLNVTGDSVIVNCTIRNNSAGREGDGYGAGLFFSDSTMNVSRCRIVSNSIVGWGAGVACWRGSVILSNCTISDNAVRSGRGAVLQCADTGDSFLMKNCTVTSNSTAITSSPAPILKCEFNADPIIVNTIFSHNKGVAIYESYSAYGPYPNTYDSDPTVRNCLFFANSEGDYFDRNSLAEEGTVYWSADALNAAVPEASRNISGDPLFADLENGDFHLLDGSRALDRGNPAFAPATDFEGDPRPGDDKLVDIGVDEAPPAYEPQADVVGPISAAGELPAMVWSREGAVAIPYTAQDVEHDVDFVELYYRKDGGEWTLYDKRFTASPCTFKAPEGEGYYAFYTIGTDSVGNAESAPATPDAQTYVAMNLPDGRVYVDRRSTGTATGASWANAVANVSTGIFAAKSFGGIDSVWVAEGTYSDSISMESGISLHGGFAGTETRLSERDPEAHETVLDASECPRPDNLESVRVVLMDGTSNANLSGFVITGGTATDGGGDKGGRGAGILCMNVPESTTISDCKIIGNSAVWGASYLDAGVGGGIALVSSAPRITRCEFRDNSSNFGGGLYVSFRSSLNLTSCTFTGNFVEKATEYTISKTGGALFFDQTREPGRITNCVFSANRARWGGVAFCNFSSPVFQNCTFVGNEADLGGAVAIEGYGTPTIPVEPVFRNSIFADNSGGAIENNSWRDMPTIEYCLFHANPDGDFDSLNLKVVTGPEAIEKIVPNSVGNRDGDPLFVSVAQGDFHLREGSPCIDAGTNANAPAFDLDGNPRPVDIRRIGSDAPGWTFDIGAYERQGPLISPESLKGAAWFLY